jgi:5'-nucleotidase
MMKRPFLLLSNDDGIASPGLLAAARALAPIGRLLVVAPMRQHSGWGRAMPHPVGPAKRVALDVDGDVEAWSVDASPSLSVRWALYTRVTDMPDLVVSGINYGENIGVSLPISGTVGAACEAASIGPRAIAVSLQTDPAHFRSHSDAVDFTAAAGVTARVANMVLQRGLPDGVDVLNVNVPSEAAPDTPWRWTRVSRHHYFESIVHEESSGERRISGWRTVADPNGVEADSDIRTLALDEMISISPLTVDPTAREVPDWLDGHGLG